MQYCIGRKLIMNRRMGFIQRDSMEILYIEDDPDVKLQLYEIDCMDEKIVQSNIQLELEKYLQLYEGYNYKLKFDDDDE